MPDTLHKPGNTTEPNTGPSPTPEENQREARQQPYTPANLNVDYGAPRVAGPAAENPHGNRDWSQTASPPAGLNQSALNQTAEKIGAAIGTAVNIVRSIQRQLQSVPNNVVSIRQRVRERGEEFRQDASEAAREWRQNAQIRMQQARQRTAQYVHDNPFHVIAAVAGVAFCLGVGLRIWRSNLD